MLETEKTRAALALAERAHAGQVDKAGAPYLEHLRAVAQQMRTEDETCAALLHDVLEDTPLTADDLRAAGMSEDVVDAVRTLTHDVHLDYFAYIAEVKKHPLAARVKRADLAHNADLSRIAHPTAQDRVRRDKYLKALALLADE